VNERIAAIESMLEEADPAAIELVRHLLGLYGEGLARVMELAGERTAELLAADELLSPLLVLHDLHPLDARTRVVAALEGGDADLLAIEDGRARLRFRAAGCRSSRATAQEAVRAAVLAAAPEIEHVEFEHVESEPEQSALIPVESLSVRPASRAAP
jgi:Fe-S cluster biogenesis protein NfuA